MLHAAAVLLAVLGSLAVFLIGIDKINAAVLRRHGRGFARLIGGDAPPARTLGRGAAAGLFTGSPASGVVLLVSMVSTGSVSLAAVPFTLLGINMGALGSGWVIALAGYSLGLPQAALVLLALALPYAIGFGAVERTRGELFVGVGLALLGIQLLNGSLPGMQDEVVWVQYLRQLSAVPASAWIFAALGLLCAALFRSSLGVLVLAMSFAFRGWLGFDMAAALVAGGALGVPVTGFLAARRLGMNAVRTACMHLCINTAAVAAAVALFPWMLAAADQLLPGERFDPAVVPLRLALFQSLMHTAGLLIILTCADYLPRLSRYILPERPAAPDWPSDELQLLPSGLPEAVQANLLQTQNSLAHMADMSREMLMIVMNTSQFADGAEAAREDVRERKTHLADLRSRISRALTASVQQQCSQAQAEMIQQQQRIAHEIKGIGDDCYRIMLVLCRSYRKRYRFHEESEDELFGFSSQVLDFLQYNSDYLQGKIAGFDLELAARMESGIDAARDKLKKRARKYLEKHQNAQVKGELAFIEIVGHLEHIGDSCLHISRTVARLQRSGR